MKMYGVLLLILVLAFVAGCSQTPPVNTPPVQNEQTNTPPVQNVQTEPTKPVENSQNNEQTTTPPPVENTPPVPPAETNPDTPPGISTTELASHNERADCWVGYKGKVYDITSFVPKHPGGASKITPYCGTASEFEKAFTRQHGTSQVSKLMQQTTYMGDLQ